MGLLPRSILFDVVSGLTDNGKWSEIYSWMISVGVVGGLAVMGFGAMVLECVPDGARSNAPGSLSGRPASWGSTDERGRG